MSCKRVAIIYDDTDRPETTGGYCRRALQELTDVEHFLPSEAETIPRQGFDLYLQIDDGLESRIPPELRPCAWWVIDTHLDFAWRLAKARGFDCVFTAQRDGAERMRREGIASAQWLPLACDPGIHSKLKAPKSHDFCFVGNIFPGERETLIKLLQKHFPNHFVGRRYFEEMAQTYSASRLVFNRSIRNDVNMRVFEAVACGSLLLTNDLRDNGQAELFQDGVHLVTYRDPEELLDKARFYLAREGVREKIAAAGHAEAVARHTYRHRMETILEIIDRHAVVSVTQPASSASRSEPLSRVTERTDNEASDPREPGYFDHARPELLALIPQSARRVLDVGCGRGRLGESLKARQAVEVVGIECDERAVEAAKSRLDQVVTGDVEKLTHQFAPASFDVIVCGDVLEHLREPMRWLRRAREWLAPEGKLVASIPNVRHHSVLRGLLAGNWTYEAAGLLDQTHLRFFTRRSIEDLFTQAGFQIRKLGIVPGDGYDEWAQKGQPGEVRVGRLNIGGLPREEAEEFFVYQYLVTAQPVRPTKREAEVPPPSSRMTTKSTTNPVRGPIRFTQDFLSDFEQFDLFGAPFAFARYADGERAICMGNPIVGCDGWEYPGGRTRFAEDLLASLHCTEPDFYYGISDGCCDRPARDWYLDHLRVPLDQVTFSNIFVNWNYRRFQQLNLQGAVIVGCEASDFAVPSNVLSTPFDFDALVTELLAVDCPILVAAGPASGIIIHKYWQRASRKQVIVDVGSAIDELLRGKKTRPYQERGTRTAELVCRW